MNRIGSNAVCFFVILVGGIFRGAYGQCAMCKTALENSGSGHNFFSGLNLGILVLLVPPVVLFCFLFGVALIKSHWFEGPTHQFDNDGSRTWAPQKQTERVIGTNDSKPRV